MKEHKPYISKHAAKDCDQKHALTPRIEIDTKGREAHADEFAGIFTLTHLEMF